MCAQNVQSSSSRQPNIDEKIYGMTLYDLNILWQVQANNTVEVISLNKVS